MQTTKAHTSSVTVKALCLLALFLVSSVHAESLTPPDSLQAFWTAFRHATITDDREKIISLTHFPFKTRGVSDWDPVLKHDKAWLSNHYSDLLAIDHPILTSTKERGNLVYMDTMRALIERTEKISIQHGYGDDFFRVEAFEFMKINGQWLFTWAYWQPKESNPK